MKQFREIAIPNMVWTQVQIEDKVVWVYQQTGNNINLAVSFDNPLVRNEVYGTN